MSNFIVVEIIAIGKEPNVFSVGTDGALYMFGTLDFSPPRGNNLISMDRETHPTHIHLLHLMALVEPIELVVLLLILEIKILEIGANLDNRLLGVLWNHGFLNKLEIERVYTIMLLFILIIFALVIIDGILVVVHELII
ncbi:hypothetical protein ACJX0J_033597, partial [Zea mays]